MNGIIDGDKKSRLLKNSFWHVINKQKLKYNAVENATFGNCVVPQGILDLAVTWYLFDRESIDRSPTGMIVVIDVPLYIL